MMVDQSRHKRGWVFSFFLITAVLDVGSQVGIAKLSLVIFLFNRTVGSPNGSLSLSVA